MPTFVQTYRGGGGKKEGKHGHLGLVSAHLFQEKNNDDDDEQSQLVQDGGSAYGVTSNGTGVCYTRNSIFQFFTRITPALKLA